MTSGLLLFCLSFILSHTGFSQVSGISSSNLPLVIINTNGNSIQQDIKVAANLKIIFNGAGKINQLTDPANIYNGNIGIEIRGNYSASLPQKPYSFETRDASGKNLNVSLLGMPEENDWILLANYNDKTFMRNTLAYELFRKMGHYAPRTFMVEVVVNNAYQGIYILTEKIKQDKGRVDIAKLTTLDITGDALTGGYIFKIDYYNQSDNWQSSYQPVDHPEKKVNYVYVDPDPDALVFTQKSYLKNAVNAFEAVLQKPDFSDKVTGYPAWIDVTSFLDYFIVSEVSRNVDAYKKSVFFFKEKDSKGGKISAGPVWDFDWAWKNIWDCSTYSATDGSGWTYKINDCPNIYPNSNGWMVRLLQDPDFANALNKRYFDLRNSYLSNTYLQSYIDSVQNLVAEAQARHYSKWNILGSNVGAPEVDSQPSTYAGQLTKFSNWIKTRLGWLDSHMPGTATTNSNDLFQTDTSYRIFPNPATDQVYIEASAEIETIEIFRSNGASVIRKSGVADFTSHLNISGLQPGIYLIRLGMKGQSPVSYKLLVK
ncbi:MAG: CotH kinase family protein [Prolixibacteraceae bacterium]